MAEKKSLENRHTAKEDSYASEVFQESYIGVISSLSQTDSARRKAFKVLAFFLCLFGFLYQSGQFLAVVFQYPTAVDVEIVRPDQLSVPGYTFCDNNGINRRIFCEKFPDRCEMPTEAFCKKFEEYCGENATMVPKKQYYRVNYNMTLEELVDLNVNMDEFVERNPHRGPPENLTGPYLRKNEFGGPSYICYSLYDRVNNGLPHFNTKKEKLFKEPVNEFSFYVKEDETFLPGTRPGILFSIHSPFDAVNPFKNGIFMKPGRTYMIFVSMEEEVLLQKPYPTDCVNYTEMWEKRGRTGFRTQDMCLQDCISDISMLCYNCVFPLFIFPRNDRICSLEDIMGEKCAVEDEVDELIAKCNLKCKDDCHRIKYTYDVQERFSPELMDYPQSENELFTRIAVEIYVEGDEIVVLKHSPKYMIVEVFSNIGGFIGCWLGISLLDITDIFEGFFRIARHSFKKKGSKGTYC